MKLLVSFVAAAAIAVVQVCGHGAMYDPPGRSSMWRFGFNTSVNYDDNQIFCGGMGIQWGTNGGKCGVCGDAYNTPTPRPNEDGGIYGTGAIVKSYKSGAKIPVTIHLTVAHKGDFTFSLCNLDKSKETEECFQPLKLGDQSDKLTGIDVSKDYNIELILPSGLTCKHCVLRWHYRAGNTYGDCGDGHSATGCGPQETFRNCADISINKKLPSILNHGLMDKYKQRTKLWEIFQNIRL